MRSSTSRVRMLLAAAIAAAGPIVAATPPSITSSEPKRLPRPRRQIDLRNLSAKQAEIKAWNDAVEARKRAKKGGA